MQIPTIVTADNVFTFLRPSGRSLSLTVGDIVRAEVVNVLESGSVSLAISSDKGGTQTVIARTEVPLAAGDKVILRVTGGEGEVRLRLVGTAAEGVVNSPQKAQGDVHEAILRMFSNLAGFRLAGSDLKDVFAFFRSLPPAVKDIFPQLAQMEQLLPQMEQLTGRVLQESVEGSGVLFETKLGKAARELMQQGGGEGARALDPDLKGIALRLKELLRDEAFTDSLRSLGVRPQDVDNAVDKVVRHIEYFQLSSKINDIFYSFLPVSWDDLRDGELSFRRGREGEEDSYTCDINLSLEEEGRISASVTLFGGGMYVTIYAEDPGTKARLLEARGSLEARFSSAGLDLRVLNIGHMRQINLGAPRLQGLDMKV